MRLPRVRVRHLGCLLFAAAAAGQEVVPPPVARANAGAIYDLALHDLRRCFGIAPDGALELPPAEEGEESDAQRQFAAAEWGPALAKAGAAVALFAQAAQIEACEFPPAKEPLFAGYDEVSVQLHQLAQLVAAHGWRQLPGAPASALADVRALLGHARHAMRQPTSRAASFGGSIEVLGVSLLQATIEVAPATGKLRADCLRVVREHAAKRATRAELADQAEAEIHRMLSVTLEKGAGEPAAANEKERPDDKIVRENAAEVAAKVRQIAHECLGVLRREPPASVAEIQAAMQRQLAHLQDGTRRKEIEQKLGGMTREQAIDVLSRRLALMVLPNIVGLAETDAATLQRLQHCRDLLDPPSHGK